ncbi:MAG TPA: homoserine kinase [Flavobacteriaceae bacterium]|nr:homoserine kinase [Flavobacteriaceae bacterium]HAT65909.1 homoserine kinase [Flavobacteriaceae bacterium]|tara:strand:+ start:562 stop:1488 length:927 start_codon:yes stop_codon:yes gene_type:complete
MEQLRIFSPATVANVSCGFDALGFALDGLGDEMFFTINDSKKVTISKVEGATLPMEISKNAAGVVAQKMLEAADFPFGIDIEIYKKYKPGSGLGSSAASSAGTAFAINHFLGGTFSTLDLVKFAMLGEEAACGSQIADNVSAALFGGFVLIRSYLPLEVVSLPTPAALYAVVIHPQVEIKTRDARDILPEVIPIRDAVAQWANVGGLISGLYTNNYELIGRSLIDLVAEPARKILIPFFDELKRAALDHGALGAGISGSGPSVFALCKGEKNAQKVALAFNETYDNTGIDYHLYVSALGREGVKILKN